jgi:vitamin B12/bleomycin/antimicrobial peptide transport system ATP-binding/permease protein
MPDPAEPTFDRHTISRIKGIVIPFFRSEKKKKALVLLSMLLGFAIAVALVQVLMSYAARDFMDAFTARDAGGFKKHLWLYLGTFALAVPIGVWYRYTEEKLALLWRQWMTQHLLKRYFANRAYYHLRSSDTIDNPDQRISEDVKNFTTATLSFLLITLNSFVTLVAFTGVLWSISFTLVVVLIIYAIAGTAISILIGRRLVGIYYHQYEKEGNFRYGMVRVRDNAESIAFYRGEKREHRDLIYKFADIFDNTTRLIGWNRKLSFFTTSYNYFALIIPTLVVAPLYFAGKLQIGTVLQAGGAFAAVLAATSLIITQFERLSNFAAGVTRLDALWTGLSERDPEEERDNAPDLPEVVEPTLIDTHETGRRLTIAHLDVQTPDGNKVLLKSLDLKLKPGTSILLMGPSGSGKSSLLRTIAGLWNNGAGSITRPPLARMMFLPQRPYMVQGSLRDQLLYPGQNEDLADEQITDVLSKLNLADIADRVDGDFNRSADWTNVLSLGEQQRLSFARLVLRQPVIAFLDEATSALDEPNEAILYNLLKKSNLTFISVGHRSTLKQYHDQLLSLSNDATWLLEALPLLSPLPHAA